MCTNQYSDFFKDKDLAMEFCHLLYLPPWSFFAKAEAVTFIQHLHL